MKLRTVIILILIALLLRYWRCLLALLTIWRRYQQRTPPGTADLPLDEARSLFDD